MICLCCYNDIEDKVTFNDIIIEYCYDCLLLMLQNQWNTYINLLKSSSCKATLITLIKNGPPLYFKDSHINNGEEIKMFKYKNNIIDCKITPIEKDKLEQLDRTLKSYLDHIDDLNVTTILKKLNL